MSIFCVITATVGEAGDLRDLVSGRHRPRAASLLVSVFGDAVVPHGGVVWLGSLIRWLAGFGINERAVRTAAHRLVAEDWFATRATGRRSDYRLTAASRHRFADAERRIYAASHPSWDGSWSVIALGRGMATARRDEARRELRWHGFGELAPSVLVHPAADLEELALALRDLRVERSAVVLRARGENGLAGDRRALRALVDSAWDLSDLAAAYRAYVRRFDPVARRVERSRPGPEACFRLRVAAIHEYRRILLRDPELPAELLPEDWVGGEARRVCAALYRRVAPGAVAYVLETGRTATGPLPPPGEAYYRRFGGLARRSH
jgi:phenylacetic acid degradation operon negative regulatory protein